MWSRFLDYGCSCDYSFYGSVTLCKCVTQVRLLEVCIIRTKILNLLPSWRVVTLANAGGPGPMVSVDMLHW